MCIPGWPGPHIDPPNTPMSIYLPYFFKFNFKNIYLFSVSMYMYAGTCTPEDNPWELVLSTRWVLGIELMWPGKPYSPEC